MGQSDLWQAQVDREDAVAFRRRLRDLQAECNAAEKNEQRVKGEYGQAARRTREAHLKLRKFLEEDLRNDEYQPTMEQVAQAVGALAGRTLMAVDWWPLDSIGQMVIRLAVPREAPVPERTANGLPATTSPTPKKGKRKAVKS